VREMPCVPQRIFESDQAFALFTGLVMFIRLEVAVDVVGRIKRRRKER
jgi:hypothetical protein